MYKKFNFPYLLLSLVPVGYIIKGTLPFDLTLVVYILLYISALKRIIIERESLYFQRVDLIFCYWVFILFIGTLYSPMQMLGFFKATKFLFLGISLIYFLRLFIKSKEDFEKIIMYFLITSVLTGYLVLIDFLLSGSGVNNYRAFGVVVPIPLSMLGATTTMTTLFLIYYKKIKLFLFLFAIIPSFSMMTLAGSKGPVISLIVTMILLSPVFLKRIRLKLIFFVLIGIYGLLQINFVKSSLDHLLSRFEKVGEDMSTISRLSIYKNTLDSFFDKPIFGLGTSSITPYPHNLFLEVLAENGLTLFVALIVLVSLMLIKYLKYLSKSSKSCFEGLSISLLLISFISLMFSFTYVDHKYLFLSIGLLMTYKKVTYFSSTKKEH
ncbi:O-antigen ligase family protein [Bacillus sp. V3]|nr:O-antigen ligase family protein [Bacillus sp. V3]